MVFLLHILEESNKNRRRLKKNKWKKGLMKSYGNQTIPKYNDQDEGISDKDEPEKTGKESYDSSKKK